MLAKIGETEIKTDNKAKFDNKIPDFMPFIQNDNKGHIEFLRQDCPRSEW